MSNHISSRVRAGLFAVFLAGAVSAAPALAGASTQQTPYVTPVSGSGYYGGGLDKEAVSLSKTEFACDGTENLNVTGVGFYLLDPDVTIAATKVGTASADFSGKIDTNVKVPKLDPGTYKVIVKDQYGVNSAEASITCTAKSSTSTTAAAGSTSNNTTTNKMAKTGGSTAPLIIAGSVALAIGGGAVTAARRRARRA